MINKEIHRHTLRLLLMLFIILRECNQMPGPGPACGSSLSVTSSQSQFLCCSYLRAALLYYRPNKKLTRDSHLTIYTFWGWAVLGNISHLHRPKSPGEGEMLYCDTWETCNILDWARNTCRGPVLCQPVTGWWYFIWLIAATPVTRIRIWSIDYECNKVLLYYGLHNNRYFPLLEERVQSNIWQQHLTTWRQRIYHSVYWLDSNVPNNLSTLLPSVVWASKLRIFSKFQVRHIPAAGW